MAAGGHAWIRMRMWKNGGESKVKSGKFAKACWPDDCPRTWDNVSVFCVFLFFVFFATLSHGRWQVARGLVRSPEFQVLDSHAAEFPIPDLPASD